MSHYDYECSKQILLDDPPLYALIMAAMRKADSYNLALLREGWPHIWDELQQRYNAPGGLLPTDMLPEVTVPSAAISDEQTSAWSDELYARDLDRDK
jgi:hypothetical protein